MNRSKLKVGDEVVVVSSPLSKWDRLSDTGYWTATIVEPKADYPYRVLGTTAETAPGVEVEITGWVAGHYSHSEGGVKPYAPGRVGSKLGGNTAAEVCPAPAPPYKEGVTIEKVTSLPPVGIGDKVTIASRLIVRTVEEQKDLDKAAAENAIREKAATAKRKAHNEDLMERYAALGIETRLEGGYRGGGGYVRIRPEVDELLVIIEGLAEERDALRRRYDEEVAARRPVGSI